MVGPDKVGPHPLGEHDPQDDEGGERGGHRGHRPAKKHAGGHTQCKGEGRITNWDEPAFVEYPRSEMVQLDLVNRAEPPAHHQTEEPRDGHAGEANDDHSRYEPSASRDALGPGKPECLRFHLASDERCPPKDPGDRRDRGDSKSEQGLQQMVVIEDWLLIALQSSPGWQVASPPVS